RAGTAAQSDAPAPASPAPPSAIPPVPPPPLLAERTAPPPVQAVVPLAPARYRVQFSAGASLEDKLTRAQALLRPRAPTGDLAEVVERALDAATTASAPMSTGALGGAPAARAAKSVTPHVIGTRDRTASPGGRTAEAGKSAPQKGARPPPPVAHAQVVTA